MSTDNDMNDMDNDDDSDNENNEELGCNENNDNIKEVTSSINDFSFVDNVQSEEFNFANSQFMNMQNSQFMNMQNSRFMSFEIPQNNIKEKDPSFLKDPALLFEIHENTGLIYDEVCALSINIPDKIDESIAELKQYISDLLLAVADIRKVQADINKDQCTCTCNKLN